MFEEEKIFCKNCRHCIQRRVKNWECKKFPSSQAAKGKPKYVSCEVMRDPCGRCGENAILFQPRGK